MEVIPAIDLLGGRVVRLAQGAFDAVTDYGDDPVAVARRWAAEGAPRIHVVDLDAARDGRPQQADVVRAIVASARVPCQVAGGIRGAAEAGMMLDAGADRVVLGSGLIADPGLGGTLVARHGPQRIVAALDVRDGHAVGEGWVAGALGVELLSHAASLAAVGLRTFIVTSIARDGGMEGPDLELLEAVRGALPGARIIASGGIGRLADLAALAERGFAGAITGRALYEGAFSLAEALAQVRRSSAP
jgi:phosphoribosylformimino-5-aminoimidazole carboxamide ribotide isomerase